MLDIDETSLSNWANSRRTISASFQLGDCTLQPKEPCGFNDWISIDSGADQADAEFFTMAKAKGLEVFFITGRREEQRADTVRNLTAPATRLGRCSSKPAETIRMLSHNSRPGRA